MSDTTLIASDMALSGILHAKDQTVIIEGRFEGEVHADNIFVHTGARFEGVAVTKTAEIDGVLPASSKQTRLSFTIMQRCQAKLLPIVW